MFDKIKFGNTIKKLCKINHLTAYQLSQKLNVSEDYLYKIQNGKNIPSIAMFISIINYFGLSAENFYYFDIKSSQQNTLHFTNIEYKFLYETLVDYVMSNELQ